MIKRITVNLAALAALFLLCAAHTEAAVQRVGVVNVNTATLSELQLLPGVGPAMAARIVAGRPYAAPGDLARIKGLGGEKRLATLLPHVATSGATTLHEKVRAAKHATDSQRPITLYSPAAQNSIRRGLADGSVRFEPSETGGEYIWSAQ